MPPHKQNDTTMKVTIKINNIPFDEQIISRSLLKFADNSINVDKLTDEQCEQFEEDIVVDFGNFNVELSSALAYEVCEEYGEEYGNAFRGVPDNGDGIWFDGIDVDYDTFDEIRTKCRKLANDTAWLNDCVTCCIIEYDF